MSHYIKERKGAGIVMSKTPTEAKDDDSSDEYAQAKEIAQRWQRLTP